MTITEPAWCTTTPKRHAAGADSSASGGLKSVGTALDVLECFAIDSELGVSDIARRLGVAKSTAHRLLTTLASRGFVEQDQSSGLYRLGIHIYELGHLALSRNSLRHTALPILRQVAQATGLTVNLGIPDGPDIVFIERLESADSMRFLGHAGRRLPVHVTSSGKVIAAFNIEAEEARRRAGFPPRVSRTVRTAQDWDRVLENIRKVGYAVSTNESFDGASSVAVPVIVRKVAIASVSVFGPSELVLPKVDKLVPVVTAAARRIGLAYSS